MMRLLHLVVIAALVASAAYVYKIKFDSTVRAERVARLRAEIKRERDAVAALRAQWEALDSPARIQALTERHLTLKPLDANQVDELDRLPERPRSAGPPDAPDPIAAIIENDDDVSAPQQSSGARAMSTPERVAQQAHGRGAQAWHRRLMQALLYGRNVDRDRKARARLGLAVLAFSIIYLIIGARLVLYAVAPESHVARRSANSDAVATARPDILDRNGEVLATDVLTPSLFAEPRRIIDADEASELLTAVMPDLAGTDLRERLASKRGFVWLKREISAKQQFEVHKLGVPGVGFLTENKRVYPKAPRSRM